MYSSWNCHPTVACRTVGNLRRHFFWRRNVLLTVRTLEFDVAHVPSPLSAEQSAEKLPEPVHLVPPPFGANMAQIKKTSGLTNNVRTISLSSTRLSIKRAIGGETVS
jgi:hypothetical protein